MTDPAAPPTAPFTPHPEQLALDAQGRLGRDLPCRSCGYNLRGLSPDSGCPECGLPLSVSLRGDLLRFSDPDWVKGLARGVSLILAAILLIIAAYLVAVVVTAIVGAIMQDVSPPAQPGPDVAQLVALAFTVLTGLVVLALNLMGTWSLTDRDPGQKHEVESISVRLVARWGVIGGWVLYLAAFLLNVAFPFASLLALPAVLLLMAGFIAILIHLRRLALRVPDRGLGAQTAIVMWGFVVLWVGWLVMIVGMIAMMVLMFSGINTPGGGGATAAAGTAGFIGIMALACVFSLAGAVFGIWLIVLLFLYRSRFRRAADEAAQQWGGGAMPVG